MVDAEHPARRAQARLHLVKSQVGIVLVSQFGQSLKETGFGDALAARALYRLDDNADNLIGHLRHCHRNHLQRAVRARPIRGLAFAKVQRGKRQLDIAAGRQAVEVFGGDRIGGLRDRQREHRAPVKRLIEINKTTVGDATPVRTALRVELGDQVLEHVLDRLRAGVDGIDFQRWISHRFRREAIQQAVVFQAFRRQEIRVGDLVVGGAHQAFHILRLVQTRMVMGDQLGAEVARPVEQTLPVHGRQPHARALRQVERERVRRRDDVPPQLFQHHRRNGAGISGFVAAAHVRLTPCPQRHHFRDGLLHGTGLRRYLRDRRFYIAHSLRSTAGVDGISRKAGEAQAGIQRPAVRR